MTLIPSNIFQPKPVRWITISLLFSLSGLNLAATPWMIVFLDRWMVDIMTDLPRPVYWFMFGTTQLGLGYIFLIIFIVSCLLLIIFRHLIIQAEKPNIRTYHWISFFIHRLLTNIFALLLVMPFVYVLKVSIGRYRPGPYLNNDIYRFEPFHRFDLGGAMPSGHSADIAALCVSMVMWAYYIPNQDRWKLLTWIWASSWIFLMLLVAFSRIALQWHFPSDTTFGMLIGASAAYTAGMIMHKYLKKDILNISG